MLAYGWPRISAALGLTLSDYYPKDKRWYIRVNEKGGEEGKEILLHYDAKRALDAYYIYLTRIDPLLTNCVTTAYELTSICLVAGL